MYDSHLPTWANGKTPLFATVCGVTCPLAHLIREYGASGQVTIFTESFVCLLACMKRIKNREERIKNNCKGDEHRVEQEVIP
jgi:hypothetical protein